MHDPAGRGLLGQVKKQVDAHREIARPDAWHPAGKGQEAGFIGGEVTRRADDDGLALFRGEGQEALRGGGCAEIDDHVTTAEAGRRIVADINRGSNADAKLIRGGDQGSAHPAAGAIEQDREGHGAK